MRTTQIDDCGPMIPELDGGICYRVQVHGDTVMCRFTREALQAANPLLDKLSAEDQFTSSRIRLMEIASKKIEAGEDRKNAVWVKAEDL